MTSTTDPTPSPTAPPFTEREILFREQFDPILKTIAEKSKALGMPVSMAIEIEHGNTAYVFSQDERITVETMMIRTAIQLAPNLDAVVMQFLGFCTANNIDLSGSIVASLVKNAPRN